MKPEISEWPLLFVSAELNAATDDGFRLRELTEALTRCHDCEVIPSFTYEDALEVFTSRADLGAVVIDWDLPLDECGEKMRPECLLHCIRRRNKRIPVLLITDRMETEALPADVLSGIDDCLWKTADTPAFIAGRIAVHIKNYLAGVMPEFFGELVKYSEYYKYAWHTPGHLGGQGFLRAPAGVAMYKFFGENTFRADLSISVPELGSLLDHEGPVGDAEKNSARVFGADRTYYVLNGTSTVNQIVWRSQVLPGDLAFVDRNCHKSLNYAMVITEAVPVYMIPRRNARGIIGPIRMKEFSEEFIAERIAAHPLIPAADKSRRIRMSALTNSTYDGLCYNVSRIKKELGKHVDNLHFDEAWYAYAKFNPLYRDHFGMAPGEVKPDDPPVFCSQSTHKLLTAFSQASMLHIRNGGSRKIDPVLFNESYMMHGSTSPQYQMIASLDVATKMMEDSGETLIGDIIREAIGLRRKIAAIRRDLERQGDWFFGMWQPEKVTIDGKCCDFADADPKKLATCQEAWELSRDNNWHGFSDIEDHYVMLDPIKLTVTTPGLAEDGRMDKHHGIPASIVTNYLIKHNIVCEKTDYYSFLLLNSLGTTRAKQGSLLAALFKFKELYDSDAPLAEAAPELVQAFPDRYAGETLKEHCDGMHRYLAEHDLLGRMHAAFEVIPKPVLKPADAYHKVVAGEVESVRIYDLADRIAAVMLVPYPPGIPILMGGELVDDSARPIFDYLQEREAFENAFPGYESDIHGVERERCGDRTYFRTLVVKK
jgi:lysine decarboxylase/arginine decarboxylase